MDSNLTIDKTKYKTPWFVLYISITIIAQYLLINYKENFTKINPETFTLFGAPDTVSIYDGQFWGVFTNNFIHIYFSQLIFNLIGIWFFGAFIERRIGALRLISLMVISCVIPSLGQLAITSEPGIGLSGVNYALFGYILIRSKKGVAFKLKGQYIFLTFMLGVLAYCNYYNFFVENVFRTEAMTIGLLLGLLLGKIRYGKKINRIIIVSSLSLIAISTLFYAPWSYEWQLYKGVEFHESRDLVNAKKHYLLVLKMDPGNKTAKDNLQLLDIEKLEKKAYDAHVGKNYELARKYYLQILKEKPDNVWARENLNELP
jgi:membrane associated rhomboid family serine protease